MLGIGMQEILLILVVALIFIGPKRLPELAKTLGKGFSEFKRATDNIQETVRKDLERERHEELKKKYPGLVPEEDPGAEPATEAKSAPSAPADGVPTQPMKTDPDDPRPAPEKPIGAESPDNPNG